MLKMTFINADGSRKEVETAEGKSVMEIAQQNGIDIEGACEGSMACSTCHVIVDAAWFPKLETACEEEEDILDLAYGLTSRSRLGCQITMTEELDGLVVSLPSDSANMQSI
jgi:ferredoxin, 2Fe-2S